LSFDKRYTTVCGISAEELHQYFDDSVNALAEANNLKKEQCYEQLKKDPRRRTSLMTSSTASTTKSCSVAIQLTEDKAQYKPTTIIERKLQKAKRE